MRIKESWQGYLLILPVVLFFLLFFVYPILSALYISFTDQRVIGGPSKFVGIDTYLGVFSDPKTLNSIQNSLYWLIGNFLIGMPIAILGALILNENFKGKRIIQSIILIPWMIPTVATAMIWNWMLSAEVGVINRWLVALGILRTPIAFFTSHNAMLSCILINSWRFVPFSVILIYAAIGTIPNELYEAAKIDGASYIQTFRYITFPTIRKILGVLTPINIVWVFNFFDFPWLITQGGPSMITETLPIRLFRLSFETYQFSAANAVASIMFLVLTLFIVIYYKRLKIW